jgi:integrase
MLRVVPRHLRGCGESSESKLCPRKQSRKFPLWVKRHLNGKLIRRSLGTANWQRAAQRVAEIEAAGTVAAIRTPISVAEAAEKFLKEAECRELRPSTLRKFRVLLTRESQSGETADRFSPSLVIYATAKGIGSLGDFTPDHVMEFRQCWKDGGLSKLKKSERLKTFFRYAQESGWIPNNPARGIKPPKVNPPGVVAFTAEELHRIMEACRDERLKTFMLVMRFTGLAIADAVQLTPDRIQGQHLTLRRTKTNKAVQILLPGPIASRLRSLQLLSGGYYFWNRKVGDSDVQTATGNMRRSLRRVFKAADVPSAHPHQFRHLFVREHLERDVSLETIADLLGNTISIIEKHYANWVPSRQRKLDEAVQRTWDEKELDRYC